MKTCGFSDEKLRVFFCPSMLNRDRNVHNELEQEQNGQTGSNPFF